MPEWRNYIRQNLHVHGLRPDREAEIVEDLAQQLEDAYREALAGGMAETDAAAVARQHVPDWDALNRELQRLPRGAAPALEHLQERADTASRNRRWWAPLGSLLRDLLFGLRMMRKNPGFTVVVVLTLALGIGAASAIFGVVNAVLLRPLPYPNADRLAMIWELGKARNKAPEPFSVSWQDYGDWRKEVRSLEHLGVFRSQNANLTRVDPPDRLRVSMTSAEVFSAIGVRPLLGRTFVPPEDEPGAATTVILSETMWRSRFAAAPDILDRTIALDGVNYQVVGVMPDGMRFPARVDCWVPLGPFVKSMPGERGNHPGLTGVARLRPGVTLQAAQAEMDMIAERLAKQYPDSNSFVGVRVQSLYDVAVGSIRTNLLVFLGAVGLVLLIACVNIANLMLARGETRMREVAVRRALGASRSRLVSQMLTESVLPATCGALLGSGLAWFALRVLVQSKPSFIPRIDQVGMDAAVLGFTCLVSLCVAALFGLWPALRITSTERAISLRDLTRTSSARSRLRPFLVAAEAGLATMLLIGAALMIRTFTHLTRIELGFRPDHVLTLRISLPGQRYPSADKVSAFYRDLLGRVSALPRVGAIGISSLVPLGGGGAESSILPQGTPMDANRPGPGCTFGSVSGGYFQSMGIRLLGGALSTTRSRRQYAGDRGRRDRGQAFWPGQDPLGKRVAFEYRGQSPPPILNRYGGRS